MSVLIVLLPVNVMKNTLLDRPRQTQSVTLRLFKHCLAVLAVITPILVTEDLSAATYYWDSNGTTAGAGVTPTGTWGTDAFWSTSSAGTAVTANTPTTTADTLNFSAGSDTVGAYTVTLNGMQSAARVIAKTGNLTLSGGTLAIPFMNTGATLDTTGTANMVIDSGIRIDNTAAGASLIFGAVAGTSIAINGTLTSTSPSPANSIFLLQKNGTGGTVNINTNLGTDAGFLTALQGGGINGGLGTLNVNGNQTLGSTKVQWTDSGRIGTINIGSTVNTGNTVTMGQILMYHTTGNLAGANINVNSAVWLLDPANKAVGLAHSGKKGTELGIVPATIGAMRTNFGTDPADMIVQLSPCIRPPDYETDFAAGIIRQCADAGVRQIFDCGKNTAADLARYYSYRVERGKTGRMLALLALA